jgi:hypothetical protein
MKTEIRRMLGRTKRHNFLVCPVRLLPMVAEYKRNNKTEGFLDDPLRRIFI